MTVESGKLTVATNADRIRAMSDEELAEFLVDADQGIFSVGVCDEKHCTPGTCPGDCTAATIKWLQSSAKEG